MEPTAIFDKKTNILLCLLFFLLLSPSVHADDSIDAYLNMSIKDLLAMEITSVSKKKQRATKVAAAVYIITNEDIRRSGVNSIPEALRMAPGIQVSRMDSNKWAITSRGFANQFANKLLVMIDGRTVFTPSYSGVYWDAQDTLMEDIERIEVIRGPGATIWGANAVNGVINVITKQAEETVGGLLVVGAGNEEESFASLRYGTAIGKSTHARGYIKYNERDSSYASGLGDGGDDWQNLRGGFRIDGQATAVDSWTVQGDIYDMDEHQLLNLWQDPAKPSSAIYAPFYLAANRPDNMDSSGWNLLGNWEHQFSEQSHSSLQLYYDHTERSEAFLKQTHDTLDMDFQHQFQLFQAHNVIWGLGYRHISDDFGNTYNLKFLPDNSNTNLYSAFIQDEIKLLPETFCLTLGAKFEHNDYTGIEIQPSIRLVWQLNERNTMWSSVSYAVGTPSRMVNSGEVVSYIIPHPITYAPLELHTLGNNHFKSEKLLAYELGYRFHPKENLSFDLALFYNNYDDLQNFEQSIPSTFFSDTLFDNKVSAHSYGLELAVEWRPLEWWRLQVNYSFIRVSAKLDRDSFDDIMTDKYIEGSSPEHQFSIRSMMDLDDKVSLDLWVYYVDALKKTSYSLETPIPDYTSFNARLAWRPRKNVELSLLGQNLFDNHHLEFVGENLLTQTEVERSIHGKISWSF